MPMTQNNPVQSSPLQPFPNLSSVITTDDVSQKGTGSYKADYVNWCRVSKLLLDHAPGFQFHLAHYVDSSHVWKAPNGTGYVVGYFTGPNGERTPDFPQAIMDNRNNPVVYEKVTARDLTDTHRRALAACAAFTFGLAWQLWAREEIENPMRDSSSARAESPNPHDSVFTSKSVIQELTEKIVVNEERKPTDFLTKDEHLVCMQHVKDLTNKKRDLLLKDFKNEFDLAETAKVFEAFNAIKHLLWLNSNYHKYV